MQEFYDNLVISEDMCRRIGFDIVSRETMNEKAVACDVIADHGSLWGGSVLNHQRG